jgi:uncharacterized membrane protein
MKALWTLVWFSVLSVGTNAFGSWGVWSGFNVVGPLLTFAGLVGIATVWLIPDRHRLAFEHASFIAAALAVLLIDGPVLATSTDFNTDAAAFNQRATELLVRGVNPYGATFHAAHLLLEHANDFWTYTLNGAFVDKVSYPAGSFLLQAPFQLLGLRHLGTDWLDLLAWIAAAVIMYAVSPWYAKWLSPLLLLASVFTYMFAFGGTDALFVPFMMLAARRWDDFVLRQGARWTRFIGPLALGVACSIKQTPWFTVPFFLVGITIEASHHGVPIVRTLIRYVALVVAPFVAMNLPFVIWSPDAWWHGILLPMTQPLIPDGQGLVSLATHGLLHVVHPFDLQVASLFTMLALLLAFCFWYPTLKRSWMFVVPLILFLPSRSLSSYLVDFIPAAFVMVLTTERVPPRWTLSITPVVRRLCVGLPVALTVVAIVSAFSAPPIAIVLDHYGSSSRNEYMKEMTLTLTNDTDSTITPHVMAVVGNGHPVGFWRPANGSVTSIGAHERVTWTLRPPRFMKAPSYRESWLMEVLTASPAALTTTPVYTWPYGRDD